MNKTTGIFLDAGDVSPSKTHYRITWPHEHVTLRTGDVVMMIRIPEDENLLLRVSDMTLHGLKDDCGQYVHLTINASKNPVNEGAQTVNTEGKPGPELPHPYAYSHETPSRPLWDEDDMRDFAAACVRAGGAKHDNRPAATSA